MKLLAVMIYEEAYYEPSIEVMVIDEKDKQKYKGDYVVCETSKDFADVLVSVSELLERNLKIDFTMAQYKELIDSQFYTIVENYEYMIELKNKAYGLDSGKNNYVENFRKVLFSDDGGYGSFRQELVFLNEIMLVTSRDFKDRIQSMLASLLPELVNNSYVSELIKSLRERKAALETNIKQRELNLENQKNDIELQKQGVKELDKRIKELEDVK